MKAIHTAGLVAIKNRKLLLAFSRNKKAFYLPGGKRDNGESSREALKREVGEELSVQLQNENLHYYTHISAPAYGEQEGLIMEQDCFLCELNEDPLPGSEIESIKYFDSGLYKKEANQVPGVVIVIRKLIDDNLID